jgi:hypothetical protein
MTVRGLQTVRALRHLLWIDSGAGLSAGVVVLVLSGWLSEVYRLSRPLLVGMGLVNLAYGTYSGMLARLARRPRGLLVTLVLANATWAALCVLAAVSLAGSASAFGTAHLAGEVLFVGGLAALEWRERERLRHAP